MPAVAVGGTGHWIQTAAGDFINLDMCFRLHIDATGRLLGGFNFGDVVVANADRAAVVLANLQPYLSGALSYAAVDP